MKIETLKKKKFKYFLYAFMLGVLLLVILDLKGSFAKYKTTESIKIANGSLTYAPYNFKMMAMYQENDNGTYDEIETMPNSGYTINEDKSYCTLDNINKDTNAKLYTDSEGQHVIAGLSKNDKCYLYFDKTPLTINTILASLSKSTRSDFGTVMTTATTGIVYSATDDDGTSYYYAGAPTDNWIKFANLYWRIIRFNGDGTLRLIYSGTNASTTGTDTQYTTSAFNSTYSDNMYVGFKYTSGSVHGTGTKSTILGKLESFYSSKLASYANYLDTNAGFCNDRTAYTNEAGSTSGGGTGTTVTYYAAYIRLRTNKSPSLKCDSSSDLFTKSGATKGNKALTYPIGLITADEVAYAGGVFGIENANYYLYTNQYYWTMTPNNVNGGWAWVFLVSPYGSLLTPRVDETNGVRPVINLRADIELSGAGTSTNPYEVV